MRARLHANTAISLCRANGEAVPARAFCSRSDVSARHCHCPEFGVRVQNIDAAGTPLRMANTVLTLLSASQVRDFYARGFWCDETIYAAVSSHAARDPNRWAMRDRWRRYTYAQIVEASDRLTADLAARGLRQGDRVAVWLPSRLEAAVVLLACSRNGYVCCPSLHRDHTSGEIVDLL